MGSIPETKPWKLLKVNKPRGLITFWEVKFFWVVCKCWLYENTLQDDLCLTWLFITHNIHLPNLNSLTQEYIEWLLSWQSLIYWYLSTFCSEFCFDLSERTEIFLFHIGSSFWLFLFWGCSLEFLSAIVACANREAVFDFEIKSWLLLNNKQKRYFQSLCRLESLSRKSVQDILIFFLDLIFYFAPVYLFHLFTKKLFIFFYFRQVCIFFYIPMLPLSLFFKGISIISGKKRVIQWKMLVFFRKECH